MTLTRKSLRHVDQRGIGTVLNVLPRSVKTKVRKRYEGVDLIVGDHSLQIKWIGEGSLGNARRFLANHRGRPDIVVARRLSPGAREAISKAGVGWVDETGAAEIAIGSIIVSRTGQPPKPIEKPKRWAPAVIAVAEALLCGTKPTVIATADATGLSVASCTHALRILTEFGLLEARAARGRRSGRQLIHPDQLLDAYASAVNSRSAFLSLQVGVTWRDPVAGLVETGSKWNKEKLSWASTGTAAASVMAPYLTTVTSTDVYIDADSIVGLEAAAAVADFRPIEGGRLTLRPFPTVSVRQLATQVDGLRVAPWPRVYVDLYNSGVRGEEAAEHLREVVRGG